MDGLSKLFANLDPRLGMTFLGGAIGTVLVAVLLSTRPLVPGPGFDSGQGSVPSVAPLPFEPLGPDGLFRAYGTLGRVSVNGLKATLAVSRADDIVLPSGRVAAGDAFFVDNPPFSLLLPAGRQPVMLLHATAPSLGDTVVAAMIRVGQGSPVSWVPARVTGTAANPADPGQPFAYGVDSGTGSFVSPEAAAFLAHMTATQATAVFDRLQQEFSADGQTTVSSANVTVDPSSGANIVAFQSGFGDGAYASWFGLDASGSPVALLTSFDLVDDPARPTSSGIAPSASTRPSPAILPPHGSAAP